jgi:hypothetical protein
VLRQRSNSQTTGASSWRPAGRRARLVRQITSVQILVAVLTGFTTACSATTPPATISNPPAAQSVTQSPGMEKTTMAQPPTAPNTPIRIRIGDTLVVGELWGNAPAQAFIDRLPVALDFTDLNNVEKTARLDAPLPMTGMPKGDDPKPQDIGWYAPSNDVVLYYGDVGYWPGIARIGRILDGIDTIAAQRGDFSATIELAT